MFTNDCGDMRTGCLPTLNIKIKVFAKKSNIWTKVFSKSIWNEGMKWKSIFIQLVFVSLFIL